MLVVFDIDGTLANIEHRLHHVRQKPKNWAAFDAGIHADKLNEPVADVMESLHEAGATIILASGRNERSRTATEAWLKGHGLHYYVDKLYMRAQDDYRNDSVVKKEILDQIVLDYGRKPDMVFDDRPRVVQMWRENGIFVFDVNQSGEDF